MTVVPAYWWLVVTGLLAGAIVVGDRMHSSRTRRRSSRSTAAADGAGGFRLELLGGTFLTFAVIMCSFMLVVSYNNFDLAMREVSDEAGAVSALYESSGLLPREDDARRLQEDTICYARAVAYQEWPELGDRPVVAPVVAAWRVRLMQDIRSADLAADSSALNAVRTADQARTTTHQVRLVTASRAAPWYLFALLIALCAAAIFFVTVFTVPDISRRTRLTMIGGLGALLAGTLLVIVDLSHPYSGLSTVGSDNLAAVAQASADNYEALWGSPVTTCDGLGNPVG